MTVTTILAFVIAALLAGAALGFFTRGLPPPRLHFTGRPGRRRRRRRRTGYYFSDDDRSWGDGRWRRRARAASVVAVLALLAISGVVALANYKSRPNAAAGYRPH